MSDLILDVRGLHKSFRLSAKQQKIEKTKQKVKVAVNGLSFTAHRGEIFGLLAPNGAGKTTTLRMLATLIRPDAGDALVDGASIVKEPERVRERIGFLTSELKLEDCFTPNYLYDFFSHLHQVPAEVRRVRKQALFSPLRHRPVRRGEGGRPVHRHETEGVPGHLHRPRPGHHHLRRAHQRPGRDHRQGGHRLPPGTAGRGKTVLVSTHIFSLVEKLCDRVGVIIDGAMALCGTLDEVCQGKSLEDRFFDLYVERMGEDA